jgi:phage terminase small subunit
MAKAKLTDKQLRFCKEYIVDLNATQAAIRAGYSEKTAKSQGNRLLTNVDIQKKTQELADKRSERTEITADNVLKEIARLAFSDPRKLFDSQGRLQKVTELDYDVAASITQIEAVTKDLGEGEVEYINKIRFADKGVNLERLGKHLKLFTDKLEQSGPDGAPIENKWTVEFVNATPEDKSKT